MADQPEANPAAEVEARLDEWLERLDDVKDELKRAGALVDALESDPRPNVYDGIRGKLIGVSEQARKVRVEARRLQDKVDTLREERTADRRWSPDGLDELLGRLKGEFDQPVQASRRWLAELFDALDVQELAAVDRIAGAALQWPERYRAGVERVRRDLASWANGDSAAGFDLMVTLASGEGLEHWSLTPELRGRAHMLAAWIAQTAFDQRDVAREHLDAAVELCPRGGRTLAELAAFHLAVGDFDRAESDAQEAIERAEDSGNGYLELGMWAELSGDFEVADDLYRHGLQGMASFEIDGLSTRVGFIDPSGRLLARAAEDLALRGHKRWALQLADEALVADVRGAEPHPQAWVHSLRSRLLAELPGGSKHEAATAALMAGERYLWNGDPWRALDQFERARKLDPGLQQAGWLAADALAAQSLPLGALTPDKSTIDEARKTWEGEKFRDGAPKGETSWAYLTRATIADLSTQLPDADRNQGIWSALVYVERALVHDDSDAQRWGYAAQYLRYARLYRLAFEATDDGGRVSTDDRRVLTERLLLLALHGSEEEAERLARRLDQVFGHDPSVGAVRTLFALRHERPEEALRLLDLPLAAGNDPLWYLDLKALAQLAGGAPGGARDTYRRMLERGDAGDFPVTDGSKKCRLAAAAVMIGRRDDAERWLEAAGEDPTTPDQQCQLALAYAHAAGGDVDAAAEAIATAAAGAGSSVEIDDIAREARARLALVEPSSDDERERLLAVIGTERDAREAELADSPPTADRELSDALARVTPDTSTGSALARTALLAVHARRSLRSGELDRAEHAYEELRPTFDPEASIALAGVIRRRSAARTREHDIDGVKKAQRRLIELGSTTVVGSALAVADALERTGRLDEARAHLRDSLGAAADDREQQIAHGRLAELALRLGDVDGTREHLTEALALARARARSNAVGHLEVIYALTELLRGGREEAERHLDAAFDAWAAPGAGGTEHLVVAEFRRMLDALPAGVELDPSDPANTIAEWWSKRAPLDEIRSVLESLRGRATP